AAIDPRQVSRIDVGELPRHYIVDTIGKEDKQPEHAPPARAWYMRQTSLPAVATYHVGHVMRQAPQHHQPLVARNDLTPGFLDIEHGPKTEQDEKRDGQARQGRPAPESHLLVIRLKGGRGILFKHLQPFWLRNWASQQRGRATRPHSPRWAVRQRLAKRLRCFARALKSLQSKPKMRERILCHLGFCLPCTPPLTQNPFIDVDVHASTTSSTH